MCFICSIKNFGCFACKILEMGPTTSEKHYLKFIAIYGFPRFYFYMGHFYPLILMANTVRRVYTLHYHYYSARILFYASYHAWIMASSLYPPAEIFNGNPPPPSWQSLTDPVPVFAIFSQKFQYCIWKWWHFLDSGSLETLLTYCWMWK